MIGGDQGDGNPARPLFTQSIRIVVHNSKEVAQYDDGGCCLVILAREKSASLECGVAVEDPRW